ncbi:hypothetical protein WR25_21724 isoform G [Diploscapter pachys]|uniref:DUF38 domain-containing protein n=1 Tax=Diploscapter pachys TaxID=2018661 RepID=A0A2A2L533_9BILA|nr:hypothetical protein WR25_21724 isoform G [Diploscapter pachys]
MICVRNRKERKEFEEVDLKNMRLFNKYCRYRRLFAKFSKNPRNSGRSLELKAETAETFEYYTVSRHSCSNSNKEIIPLIELHWFLARTKVNRLYLNRCDRRNLWNIVDAIDSIRPDIRHVSVECGKHLQFELDDISKIEKSNFFDSDASYIAVKSCPFVVETLTIEKFRETTRWSIGYLDEKQISKLPQAVVRYISVDKGHINLREFLQNFLRSIPKTEQYYFAALHNKNGAWNWNSIREALDELEKDQITYSEKSNDSDANPQNSSKTYTIKTPNNNWKIDIEVENNPDEDIEISPKFEMTINSFTPPEEEEAQQQQPE